MTNIIDQGKSSLAGIFRGGTNTIKQRRGIFRGGESDVEQSLIPEDYPEGFIIREYDTLDLNNNPENFINEIKLVGNQMPLVPFTFGGSQRIEKSYYTGYEEPVTQVLGPQEKDVTITGHLKDIHAPDTGLSQLMRDAIDLIRRRGGLCHFVMGDWQRWGYIQETMWEVNRKTRMKYTITLSIIGENRPQNAKFIRPARNVPTDISLQLELALQDQRDYLASRPDSVPTSLLDEFNSFIGEIASVIAELTSYIDAVFTTQENIRRSIARVTGLIGTVKFRIKQLQSFARRIQGFAEDPSISLPSRFNNSIFYSGVISNSASLNSEMQRYDEQFRELAADLPQARYLTKQGDSWQKISVKFYGTAENWKKIPEYNDLEISAPVPEGQLIEIPKAA